MNKDKYKYKSIELFAGAGGLALGLEQAGFEHIGLIEKDRDAAKTLIANRPNWNVLCGDVKDYAESNLEKLFKIGKGELDLLSGGAPCQSFSTVGKKMGLDDTRGTLFFYYAIFLTKLQPRLFLFENVRGLRTHNKGNTYKVISSVFNDAGYTLTNALLDAWDYGAPQKRLRFITIGIRNDIAKDHIFTFPTPHSYKPVIGDVELEENPDNTQCVHYSPKMYRAQSLVPPGGCWSDIDPQIAKDVMKSCWYMKGAKTGILRRFKLDEPCYTVCTSATGLYTGRCHPLEVRPFSYRENARFQTFPDDWVFIGSLASKYRQVGNAVPVSLAKDLGVQMIKLLNESR